MYRKLSSFYKINSLADANVYMVLEHIYMWRKLFFYNSISGNTLATLSTFNLLSLTRSNCTFPILCIALMTHPHRKPPPMTLHPLNTPSSCPFNLGERDRGLITCG